jgi:hypothetical protein
MLIQVISLPSTQPISLAAGTKSTATLPLVTLFQGGVSPNRGKFRQAFSGVDNCYISNEIGLRCLGLSVLRLKYGESAMPGPGPMPLPDRPCSQRQRSKSGKLVVGGIFGGLGLHPLQRMQLILHTFRNFEGLSPEPLLSKLYRNTR